MKRDRVITRTKTLPSGRTSPRAHPTSKGAHHRSETSSEVGARPDGAEMVADYSRGIADLVGRWVPEVPGATAALEALSLEGVALFLNSATPHDDLVLAVRKRGWEGLFTGVRGRPAGDETSKSKVVNLHNAMSVVGITASRMVMVGDGETDRVAAAEVGCQFVGVRGLVPWKADVPLAADDMRGALELIRQVLEA